MAIPIVEKKNISYKQLKADDYKLGNDLYGIAEEVMTKAHIEVLLSAPYNVCEDNTAVLFADVDGVIAARAQYFGTRLKLEDNIFPCLSGTSLKTNENYRHLALGTEIVLFSATNTEYPFFITAGLSEMAKPLYKKMRYVYFETPVLRAHLNPKAQFAHKGIKGCALNIISGLYNLSLLRIKRRRKRFSEKLLQIFEIRKVSVVPEWVTDIVVNDGHKYMEVHDHKWLQWTLDHNFSENKNNKQSFYCIYKESVPIGFFMTKERLLSHKNDINFIIGSLVEWGTKDVDALSEIDINVLATQTYSSDVTIVTTTTSDNNVIEKLASYGFMDKGSKANIACRASKKKYPDITDITQWRIRYGYADTIFY